LLSGSTGAVTVRRLWTGAEAKNVDVIIKKVLLANLGADWGRNERTVALVGKLSYFPPPRFDAPIVSLATTGTHGRSSK
jgi:hypothetical protein